jgi:hypothetical protein
MPPSAPAPFFVVSFVARCFLISVTENEQTSCVTTIAREGQGEMIKKKSAQKIKNKK